MFVYLRACRGLGSRVYFNDLFLLASHGDLRGLLSGTLIL
jgi:hypothetical protein